MNLYLRYFNEETLVHSVEEAVNWLSSIDEIEITERTVAEIQDFVDSDARFPKRYKVRPRIYFIIIKTEAQSMEEFKSKRNVTSSAESSSEGSSLPTYKEQREIEQNTILNRLNEERIGWYEGQVNFKRVITIPSTGKHEYRDTTFSAYCKARSGADCYNRIIDYLSNRVDARSQFPSIKGKNFIYRFVGKCKPSTNNE